MLVSFGAAKGTNISARPSNFVVISPEGALILASFVRAKIWQFPKFSSVIYLFANTTIAKLWLLVVIKSAVVAAILVCNCHF